jgi:hypothetical protein
MNTSNFINPISLIEYKNVLSYDKINNLTDNVRGILHNLFSSKLFTTNIISIQDILDYYNLLTLEQSNELFTTTSYDYLILANTSYETRSIDTSYDLVSQIEEQYDYVDIIVSRLLVLDPSINREILKDLYSNFNCHTYLILSIINLISTIKEEQNNPQFIVKGNKRKYAVAIDRYGVEAIKSEYSYTLDPQILIDQLKIIINQRNPQT